MVTVRPLAVLSRGPLAVLSPFSVLSSRPILCHLDRLEDRLLLVQMIQISCQDPSVRHIIGTVRRAKSFDLRNLSLLEMRRVMTLRHPGMNGPNADLIMTVDSVDEVGYGGHANGRFTNPFLGTTWTFRFPMRYLQMTGQEARAFGPFGDRDIHPLPLSRSRSRSPPSHWRRSDSAETVNASPDVKKEHKSESK